MQTTYTLGLEGTHHCKPNTCYERIPNISGLLEEVLDGYVVFHTVKRKDINRAFDYIANRYGHCLITVESERYNGSYCGLKLLYAVQL